MENIKKIYSYIIRNEMISRGDIVCVGLSGGADSVCLLQLLYELREKLQIEVTAFHVNHCLRGEESEHDEEFAVCICKERDIPIKTFRFDIAKLAEQEKKGLEETGRIMRRRAASECIKSGFATKIALAHHINDRAETFLFNLARGSSLKGLKGISPVNGFFIRPLLCISRQDIENELYKRKIKWCTDSTNLKADYSRNKMRLNVLPYLEKNINAGSIRHICNAAQDIEEADAIIAELAKYKAGLLTKQTENKILISDDILKEKKLIAGYIIMNALKSLTGTVVDLTREHISDILELIGMQTGKRINLPYNIIAEKAYDGLILKIQEENNSEKLTDEAELKINGSTIFNNINIECSVFDIFDVSNIPKKIYTKWFDYDKISSCLVVRYRRDGDYFISDKQNHRKKLKDYFIDNKIPRELRNKIPCIADGSKILWSIGYRISDDMKITENTKRILQIKVTGENFNE